MKFRVWCLSWDDTEDENGYDVETGRLGAYESSWTRGRIISWKVSDASDAAEAFADYCHSSRDGWEATWPLTFRVRSEDGTTQDFEVDREMVPEFSARPVTP